ncbi:hypothetical protein N9942_01755 [Akkermansiaceae bacterium]|nr:hypothetical protein [Akkermansiaceae bacterium]
MKNDRNESEYKLKFESLIEQDFTFEREVEGIFLVDGSAVRIDYLIYAKPHLQDRGFTDEPIGVEVKVPEDKGNRMVKVAWQAITYSQSEFKGKRPPFILIYPGLNSFTASKHKKEGLVLLTSLLPKSNVGTIEFRTNGSWKIYSTGVNYFDSIRGLSPAPNGLLKRYIGSWS